MANRKKIKSVANGQVFVVNSKKFPGTTFVFPGTGCYWGIMISKLKRLSLHSALTMPP